MTVHRQKSILSFASFVLLVLAWVAEVYPFTFDEIPKINLSSSPASSESAIEDSSNFEQPEFDQFANALTTWCEPSSPSPGECSWFQISSKEDVKQALRYTPLGRAPPMLFI